MEFVHESAEGAPAPESAAQLPSGLLIAQVGGEVGHVAVPPISPMTARH